MSLEWTDEQQMIRDSARRLLAAEAGSDRLRALIDAGQTSDLSLWQKAATELGWPALSVPEAQGGLSLGTLEALLLLEASGERLAALPLWSTTALALPLLLAVGSSSAQSELLPRIAAGEGASVAWGKLGRTDPETKPGFTAEKLADGWLLTGYAPVVTDLASAEVLLIPARLQPDGGLALFLLSPKAAGQSRENLTSFDPTRQIGALRLVACQLTASARLDRAENPDASRRGFEKATDTAQLGLCAEALGAAKGVIDLTHAYLAERVQFGRPIASFQAIKHRMARLEVDLAEARSLLWGAANGLASAHSGTADTAALERRMQASAARALASQLLQRAAEEAIQLHGGVGFTWEYDPHLYLKRAQASSWILGAADQHLARLADHLLGPVASALENTARTHSQEEQV